MQVSHPVPTSETPPQPEISNDRYRFHDPAVTKPVEFTAKTAVETVQSNWAIYCAADYEAEPQNRQGQFPVAMDHVANVEVPHTEQSGRSRNLCSDSQLCVRCHRHQPVPKSTKRGLAMW